MIDPQQTKGWLPDLSTWATLAIAATLPFWVTDLDLRLAASFYRPGSESGDWPQAEHPLWSMLYHGIPFMTAALSLAALSLLSLAVLRPSLRRWRPWAATLLLTIALRAGPSRQWGFQGQLGAPAAAPNP